MGFYSLLNFRLKWESEAIKLAQQAHCFDCASCANWSFAACAQGGPARSSVWWTQKEERSSLAEFYTPQKFICEKRAKHTQVSSNAGFGSLL